MNREKFPLLKSMVYLDSAAGTLKPKEVVQAIVKFYLEYPINPHSTESKIGVNLNNLIKEARQVVANLIVASTNEVIFTNGTTDSLNRVALMLVDFVEKDDEILLSEYNHSSNVIPWIELAKKKQAKIIYSSNIYEDINKKTKIVAYAQKNNTITQHFDLKKLYQKTKKNQAILINDAAQAVVHENVSLHEADVIAFSGNKLYGPTGIGVLAIQEKLLSLLKPVTYGGGANISILGENWIPKEGIEKFEAGTPNTAGIIGLLAAIKFFKLNNLNELQNHEKEIANYAFDELNKIEGIKFYSSKGDFNILFNVKDYSAQDVVSSLGHKNIILRSGHHCAKNLTKGICTMATIRCSIGCYNNKEDIDAMIKAIKSGGDFLDFV